MNINDAGLEIIMQCEGCRLETYPDPGTGGAPLTIGYGHCGPDVEDGMTITQAHAEDLLKKDMARFEIAVKQTVTAPLNENQFSALVAFAFNVRGWRTSTLIRLVNQQDFAGAALEFGRWTHAGGRVLPGLVTRRQREMELFQA